MPHPPFDPYVHRLGTLCYQGHEHGNTGKSLRYANSTGCVECVRAKARHLSVTSSRVVRESLWLRIARRLRRTNGEIALDEIAEISAKALMNRGLLIPAGEGYYRIDEAKLAEVEALLGAST